MDDQAIQEKFDKIAEVLQMLCERIDAIDEEVDKMRSSGIYDRLDSIESDFGSMVGGLNDIIDGRHKREYAEGFREKHPEFGRYEGIGKDLGFDVYGTAADTTFGKPEDEAAEMIKAMIEELETKLGKYLAAMEKQGAHEASETPAEEAIEEKALEGEKGADIEQPGEEKPDAKIIEIAGKFKNRRAG